MFRKTTLALALAAAFVPSLASAQDGKGERVRFNTPDGVELEGTFYAGTRRSPCVLLLHALGEGHDAKDLRRLAEQLHAKGYAVLSFDFRGHGRSRTVDPSVFWSTAFPANRQYVRGFPKEEIDFREVNKRYYPVLVNDVAAAKAYLDRKNDQGECNSSNLIVVGAEEGATLGATWLNSEWYRHRYLPAQFFGAAPQLDPNPEGRNVLAGVWLSISPKLGSRNVLLSSLLDLAGRQKKVPMVFLHAQDNARDRAVAGALEKHLKDDQNLAYTAAVPIPGVRGASGEDLLANAQTLKAIADYLDVVKDAYAREWEERDLDDTVHVWRTPQGGLVPASTMGSNSLNYNTYVQYLPTR